MAGKRGGKAGRQEVMGFSDSGGSGGYESETLNEGQARSCAKNDQWVNTAAGNNKTDGQANHVGGKYAGT